MDNEVKFLGGIVIFLIIALVAQRGYSSKVKSEIINKKFNTNYTASEMFWAGDTIEKIIEGQKIRLEVK